MLRRFLRIFCLGGVALVVGSAALTQFWIFDLRTPLGMFWPQPRGVMLIFAGTPWSAKVHRWAVWTPDDLLRMPQLFTSGGGLSELFLPWWLLLIMAGFLAAMVWRLTRRARCGAAFPVQPPARPYPGAAQACP